MRRLVMVLSVMLALVVPSSAHGTAGTGWMVLPWDGGPLYVRGMDASGPENVWVVGMDQGWGFAQRWDGTTWDAGQLTTTQLGSMLWAVDARTATDVWAVGDQGVPISGATTSLIQHWNGSKWSVVPGASIPDTAFISLRGVGAVSASDAWAVGQFDNPTGGGGGLIERWDGTHWSTFSAPSLADGGLNAVGIVNANDVWVAGGIGDPSAPLIGHWNGSTWTRVSQPAAAGSLNSIGVIAANDIWVVGSDGSKPLVEHWNGTAWSVVATPALKADEVTLASISGTAANDVWAVGSWRRPDGPFTLTEHWNGSGWKVVSSPNPSLLYPQSGTPRDRLLGVAAFSGTDAIAVGYGDNPLALRYGAGDFTSSMQLDATPVTTNLGQSTTLTGRLGFSQGASPFGESVSITRLNPDGSETQLADQAVDDVGGFTLTDTPPARGAYTYTALWPGTSERSGASASSSVRFVGHTANLTLTRSASLITNGQSVRLTAHLDVQRANRTVSIYASTAGIRRLVASGAVNAVGIFTAAIRPHKTATYRAEWTGDESYEPAKSAGVKVSVRVSITSSLAGGYATVGGYRLYHYNRTCARYHRGCVVDIAVVHPNRLGACVYFRGQLYADGRWQTSFVTRCIRLSTRSRARISLGYDRGIIGYHLRVRAEFRTDTINSGNRSNWDKLKITA